MKPEYGASGEPLDVGDLPTRLRLQAGHCLRLDSPLYADLLQRAADDAEAGGPVAERLHGHEEDSVNFQIEGEPPRSIEIAASGCGRRSAWRPVMQYLDDGERRRFELRVREAGDRADAAAPVVWLRMEPAGERAEVRLTVWPDGGDRVIARASYHGDFVDLSRAV